MNSEDLKRAVAAPGPTGPQAREKSANARWNLGLAPLYKPPVPRILPSRSNQSPSSPSSLARRFIGIGVIALIALIGLAAGESAAAATAAGSDAAPAPSASASRSATATTGPATKTKRGGKKTISLEDDFLIEGELDKPSAFFILRRSSGDYDWARLGVELVPLVLESVQDPLF